MAAIEKRLGARFVDGLCKFKGSYSRFRRAPPKPGDLNESDRDVGSVAARVSMFANMNDHEAVELFRELDGPPLFDEYGEELQFWQIKPVSPPKRYQVARGTGEKGAALASTVQLDPDGDPNPNANPNPNPNQVTLTLALTVALALTLTRYSSTPMATCRSSCARSWSTTRCA